MKPPRIDAPGAAALAATVGLWSAFALSGRALAATSLTPADAALIRFGLPALVLAPALWRRRGQFALLRPGPALKIVLGGGVPFYLAVTHGGALTSAASVGALVPGMAPVFAALLAFGTRPRGTRTAGLGLIAAGALCLVVPEAAGTGSQALTGAALLLLASGLWALYTTGLREAHLDAVASVGLLCVPTTVLLVLLALTGVLPATLPHAAPAEAALFLLVQGVGTGLCSGLLYTVAVHRLGTARCTTAGSLSPLLTAFAAAPLLAEPLTPPVLAGTALITCGVLLANRVGGGGSTRQPAGLSPPDSGGGRGAGRRAAGDGQRVTA